MTEKTLAEPGGGNKRLARRVRDNGAISTHKYVYVSQEINLK
jgi:hypothetical protein